MNTETGTALRPCCSMCLIVPDDPAALKNFGNPEEWSRYRNYWLCLDQGACVERANAQQRAARDAVLKAIEAEKAALEPMKVITDAVVADIQDLAASASAHPDTPEDGEAAR